MLQIELLILPLHLFNPPLPLFTLNPPLTSLRPSPIPLRTLPLLNSVRVRVIIVPLHNFIFNRDVLFLLSLPFLLELALIPLSLVLLLGFAVSIHFSKMSAPIDKLLLLQACDRGLALCINVKGAKFIYRN